MFHPRRASTPGNKSVNRIANLKRRSLLLPLLIVMALVGVVFSGASRSVHSSDELAAGSSAGTGIAAPGARSGSTNPAGFVRAKSDSTSASTPASEAGDEQAASGGDQVALNHAKTTPNFFPALPLLPTLTVTKVDALVNDDGDGKIDPTNGVPGTEERITYTVTITNTGTDATHLKFIDTIDAHTTLVGGSVNTQPIAIDDAFSVVGNGRLNVPVANGVLSNDFDPDGTTLSSITAFDATSTQGGNVTMTTSGVNAGAFTYEPPPGFEGTGANADTFTYTVSDGTATAIATVKIDVSGMVWYINASAAVDGDGRLNHPFRFLSSFAAINDGVDNVPLHSFHPNNNDNIFLYESGTSYVAPVTLRNGQKVIGQDSSASLTSLTGITPPSFNDPFPAVNPAGATVNISSATGGILLAQSNLLRGFSMSSIAGTAIQGTNFVTVSIFELNVASGGTALSLTTGAVTGPSSVAAFGTLSSGGGTNGVLLSGVTGTMTAANGTLTGTASGPTFAIIGGTVSVTYSGNITQGANNAAVSVTGGHATGTITFNTGTVSATSGTGLQFDNADGTYNFNGTTTLSNGDAGIDILNGSGGTFAFGGTTITNPTGVALNVNGTAAAITGGISISGAISKNTDGKLIDFFNYDTGTATISGNLSCTSVCDGVEVTNNGSAGTVNFSGGTKTLNTTASIAVNLDTNTGGAVNFTGGGLDIDTTTATGFNAVGGGTVTVTTGGNANTINSTTGTALNVVSTNIGLSGLTFQSISSNGGTNGIVLNATGTTAGTHGGLSVTGTGTTAGSGGTIQNTVQGALFTSMRDLSLKNMNFTNANTADGTCTNVDAAAFNNACQAAINMDTVTTATFDNLSMNGGTQVGINGRTVSTLSILNSTVQNFGDEPNENDVRLFNITGTATITNCDFSFAAGDATAGESLVDIRNITSTALTLNVDGDPANSNVNNFTQTQASANGSYGLTVTGASSANVTVNVRRSNFLNIRTAGIATFARGTATTNVNITGAGNTANGNTFNPGFPLLGRAIDLNAQDTAALNFNINENPIIYGTGGPIINIFGTVNAQINGHIRNNPDIRNATDTIGALAVGSAIYFHPEDSADGRVEISGNNIPKVGKDQAILLLNHGNGAALLDGIIDGIVANNTINLTGANANNSAIYLNGGANAGDQNKVCGYIHNNAVTTGLASHFAFVVFVGSAGSDVFLQNFSVDATGTYNNVANGPNTETGPGSVAIEGGDHAAKPAAGNPPFNGTCRAPTNAVAMLMADPSNVPTTAQMISPRVENTMALWTGLAMASDEPMPGIPQSAHLNELLAYNARRNVKSLFEGQVDTPSTDAPSLRGDVNASVPTTSDETVAVEPVALTAQTTTINDAPQTTATDTTLASNIEQATPSADSNARIVMASADTTPVAADRTRASKNRNMVLSHAIKTRTRTRALAAAAMFAGETVTVDGGAATGNTGFTLPAGKSITVTFQVTLNNLPNVTFPWPTGGPQVSNQGTVTADSIAAVLTDDPAPPAPLSNGATDPTVTYVDLFNSQTDVVSSNTSVGQGDSVTFTATVSFLAAGSPAGTPGTPTGTVQFTIDGNPLVCDQGSTATQTLNGSGVATCTTSTISPIGSPHTINAVYSGSGNFETSTDATPVSQTIIPCISNPVVTSNADSGANTLRDALANVCNAPNNNITFNLGAGSNTITALSTLVIAKNANITNTITGTNGVLTVTANGGNFRVFRVDSPVTSASLNGFTVTGANVTGVSGGGIFVQNGTATLTGMLFTNNTVVNGSGGGVGVGSGTIVNIRNSTISGNFATFGGGIYNNAGTLNLLNDTITNNLATGDVGGGPVGGPSAVGGGIDTTSGTATNIKNSIVAGNSAQSSTNIAGTSTDQGNNILTGDPLIAALANNGGLSRTHALLAGSPALDAGDNAAAAAIPLTTDQRGAGFGRTLDAADADTTQTVDIGAFEADPSVEDITDKSTDEDTPIVVPFNVGDAATAFGSITATSSNATLVPNLAANINITGSGSSRNLNITPAADESGTSTITVTVTKTISGTPVSMTDTFVLTVNTINDPPSFTLPGNPAAVDEDAGPQTVNPYATAISQGPNETGQTPLTFNVSVTGTTGNLAFTTAPAIDPTTGILTYEASPNTNGTASISVTLSDSGPSAPPPNSNTSAAQLFTITVNAINDPPSFTLPGDPPTVNDNAGPQTVNPYATAISQGPNETGQTLTFNLSPTGTTGTLTFSTPPAIDATTGVLTYTATNGTDGTATFDVTLSDNGPGAPPPNSNTSAAQSITITVNGVNDPPVNTVPLATVNIPQDTVLSFAGANLISVADPDATNAPSDGIISVSLTATNGTLNLNGTAGLTITSGADGTEVVAFDGLIADINTALNGMTFTPYVGYTGAASVQIVSDDKGKTGTGGVKTDTDTVNINITAPTAMYINEILFNPPGTDTPSEYIELRGTPSLTLPAGTYLVGIEGDSGVDNPGDVQTIINLSGLSFGSNGFLVLLQNGNTYTTAAGASVYTSSGPNPADAGFGGLLGGIFQADGGATDIEDASVTFMLIQTGTAPTLTDDIDSDDNGTTNGSVFAGWSVRDSISAMSDSANARAYGAFSFRNTAGSGTGLGGEVIVPFFPAYVGRRGDTTGSAAADWVTSGVLGGSAPNWTLGTTTETEPSSFAGKTLDHIGSTNFMNKVPVNTVPGAQSTDEDVPLTFTGATKISIVDTDAGTASVKVTLTATNGTFSLSGTGGLTFTPAGAGNDGLNDSQMIFTGTLTDINAALDGLTFTPTLNYSGPASLAIDTDDQGNTGVDGAKTDSDTINITVNAINDPPSFVAGTDQTVDEDAGAQTVNGFATSISQGAGDPAQTLTFNVSVAGTTGNLAFSSGPAIDSTTGNLTYTTSPDTNGTATINVTLSDNGSNVAPNSNTSGIQSFMITVNAVNDAPTFQIPAAPPSVNEDAPAQTVAGFATSFQPGPVTATDEGGQTLVGYTVTQTGTTGNVTFTSGPSIDNTGQLTYTPTGNTSGTATYNVVATDSGSGSAPNVNQSAPVSFTITVIGQNDAPVLDNTGNMSLNAINEDVPNASNNGTLVSDIIASAGGDRITDVDASAIEGIAVTVVDNTNGAWEYSIDNGTSWTPFSGLAVATARLLAADALTRVRFVPNADFNGTIDPGITFFAWDQTSGTNGNAGDATVTGGITAFSTAFETASITVNQVNDAPTANNDALSSVGEDSGLRIIPFATLTGNDLKGPANEAGQSLIVKTVGSAIGGTVAIVGGNVHFTPTADYNGPASFQYTIEDDGVPPLTSAVAATVSFTITPTPDVPSVTNATTNEDTQTTSGLIITLNPGDGPEVTHYRITGITGGTLFQNDGVTPINSGDFILVAQGAAGLKFTPALNSSAPGSFQIQASLNATPAGLGGALATATITVNPVNDTPYLDAINNVLITEDALIQTVVMNNIQAGDGETGNLTITATSDNTGLIPNPTVNYTSPNAIGTLNFTPVPNQNGSAIITVTVKDDGGTANGGLDTMSRTFTVTVTAVNDAPVNTVPGAQTTVRNTNLTFSGGNAISISDDAGAGLLQISLAATNGTLSLSTAGLGFTVGDGTDDAAMTFTGTLLSINTALGSLVFKPTTDFTGAASVQITTNDQGNTGTGGALSDTDTINITVFERTMQFIQTNFTVSETAGHATITITRLGGTTQTASVDYATGDLSGLTNCNVNTGNASPRCDFTAVAGTVNFPIGQSVASFDIPIVNDVYVEGPETLPITLSDPTGGILGTPATATVTINDNDLAPGAPNPIDNREFFVRLLYMDILNREPEPSGLAGWLNRLNTCPQPGETIQNCDEVQVASDFFRSPEFFDRAYYIYRFYEVGLGRKPDYDEFQRDFQLVAGFLTAPELEARKQQFALEFSQRADFRARYDQYDSATHSQEYVDALAQTAGVTLANRQQLNYELANSIKQRWDVLRAIVEGPEVSSKFFNKAFVVIGYFAFLRRDPDAQYLVWLNTLNTTGDYREMIRGFIQSQEYRQRFGP
jgi:hypothetical protein